MDQNSSLSGVYDFKTKAGITAILVALRKSDISSAEKNELRDLVFSYTSGGGDESVRISLEQKLKNHNIKPVVAEVVPPPPVLPFGTFRPVPTFKSPEVASSTMDDKVPQVVDRNVSPVIKKAVSVSNPTSLSQVINSKTEEVAGPVSSSVLMDEHNAIKPVSKPVMSKPTVEPEISSNVTTVASTISINHTPIVKAINSTPQTKLSESEMPVQSRSAAPIPTPVRSVTPTINPKYLERIREIKADVNTKVGNPVNLVDIDNQVGREYMNALLEAMKRLNGGVAGELDAAMKRLETAYSAVEKVVSARSVKSEITKPVVSTPKPEKAPEPVAPKLTQVTPPVLSKIPMTSSELPKDMVIPKMVPRAAEESAMPLNTISTPNSTPKSFSPINLASVAEINTKPQAVKPIVKTQNNNSNESIPLSYVHKPISNEPMTSTVNSASNRIENKIPSLAEERKLPTFNDVPAVLPTNANEIENPLYTSEIDAGLDQLLSDWSLFKKSGLFGTGPKGREHPLFKKIANLQIPLLLAGRFEGANQEIRQSITDYMNGWRYEQGIIYEQGETFEVYLRRVIKHIIDLQKRRVAA